MADLLDIAVSGLLAHQVGLNVTSQNITNANNKDYSRQEANFEARPSEFLGGYFLGTGVNVDQVRRVTDDFLTAQLRNDISALAGAETLSGVLDQLDLLFSSADTGLAGSLDNLYAALQTAVNDPTSTAARQVLLAEADALAQNFNLLYDQLSTFQRNIDTQIRVVAGQVTNVAQDIANLNQQILVATGSGAAPNDLLDKRDAALRQLAEYTGVSVVMEENGMANVFIGSGQALVVGNQAFEVTAVSSSNDPRQLELAVTLPGTAATSGVSINSGTLGALMNLQDGTLSQTFNNIGLVGLGIADSFNQLHHLGMDLEGNLGDDFFTSVNSATAIAARTTANSGNSLPADQLVEVSINDMAQVTTSDYLLTFTGANTYVLTRLSDRQANTALDPSVTGTIAGLPATLTVDGMTIDLDRPSGSFGVGDGFNIQPTRGFSSIIGVEVTRPEAVALAAPVRTDTNLNNTGTAVISAGQATDTTTPLYTAGAGQLSPPLLIRFTSPTSYDILNATTSATLAAGLAYPPVAPAGIIPTGVGLDGVQVEITGAPAAGDEFTLDYNSGGVQDNRTGLALAGLQTAAFLKNGTTTIDGAYGIAIQEIGTLTSAARSNREASKSLFDQSLAQLQSKSGVNLDEEAAQLIEFEQAYSAAAQVINVARTVFDTLLDSVRA